MKQWKLSNSQNLVLQALVSIFFSVVIGAVTAGIQYIIENGHIDYKILLSVVIAAFGALFAAALKSYIPSHALDLLQAARDTQTQVQTALTALPVVPVAPLTQPVQSVKDSTPRESPPQPQQTVAPSEDVPQQPFPTVPSPASLAATSATMVIQDKTYRVSLEPVEPQGTDVTQKMAAVKAQ